MKRFRKLLLAVAALVAALLLLAFVVGSLQPRENVAASHVELRAEREAVWAVLADFATWPTWNHAFDAVEPAPARDGKTVWLARGSYGDMPLVLERLEPPARLTTFTPADAGLGFFGSWTYELEERAGGGTRLRITERGEVPNPLFRFMMMLAGPTRTQREFLRLLSTHLGEAQARITTES